MTDAAPRALPPPIASLGEIADRYDGFIVDVWGVLHDGFAPYPGAVACLERMMAAGKRICVLSNAPRRAVHVVERMEEVGVPRRAYHEVMSSGEETWQHLFRRSDPFYAALGRSCLFVGPPRDEVMLDDLGLEKAASVESADFILAIGVTAWETDEPKYEAMLAGARRRGIPLICANPDLVVRHGGRMAACAGLLAQRYAGMGGRVRWHGKPFGEIYETCLGLLGLDDRARILGIGDSLRTDIAGAAGAGIGSLLVAGGIHADDLAPGADGQPDPGRLAAAIAEHDVTPDFVIPRLAW